MYIFSEFNDRFVQLFSSHFLFLLNEASFLNISILLKYLIFLKINSSNLIKIQKIY